MPEQTLSDDRFAFGRNWQGFVERFYSEERLEEARSKLLGFLGREDLSDMTFLDIGCGSGLHSLAAFRSGAKSILSFDYDQDSVSTTRSLWKLAGEPQNWTVTQGSVLDETFMDSLDQFDIVYSWGVLHHTGEQWRALRNASSKVARQGVLFIALYAKEVYGEENIVYWINTKRRYNAAGPLEKRIMEWQYIWRHLAGGRVSGLWEFFQNSREYKKHRGMEMMTDVRDWLGGYPIEFSSCPEVIEFLRGNGGLELGQIVTGQGNTEYLFFTPGEGERFGLRAQIGDAILAQADLPEVTSDFSEFGEEELYIYGTGAGGRKVLEAARRSGKEVAGFIDRETRSDIEGIPVIHREEFLERFGPERAVLLGSQHQTEIAFDLSVMGYRRLYKTSVFLFEQLSAATRS